MTSRAFRAAVVVGGYLSSPASYKPLVERLGQPPYNMHIEQAVIGLPTWILLRDRDFRPVVDAIAAAVERARHASPDAPVTLIGHSAGGFASRIYLGDQSYNGVRYNGQRYVNRLITLGSPHLSHEFFTRRATTWVNKHYPGAFCPTVDYITVAGRWDRGDLGGTWQQKALYFQYRSQTGNGNEWGDGVVSLAVAHLEGATQLTLEGVQHVQGRPNGYDDPAVVPRWAMSLAEESS